ncbi:diguanylate cyclase, partial [Candidatus Uhrbacteria bacterium]|nr:diguanylate cyclase [Candidatus Uhrbacteria bacterium]
KLAAKIAEDVLTKEISFDDLPASVRGTDDPDLAFVEPGPTRGLKDIKTARLAAEAAEADRVVGARQAAEADLAQVAFGIERAKRDGRTGLFQRGMYFETMESALREGKPVTTVAIDMAFLKYFDKEGGAGAGDLAIKKAADILDTLAAKSSADGVKVEAYRLGGDEFAFTVVGGDERTVTTLLEDLDDAAEHAGRIPARKGATETYRPEALQFNLGIRSAKDAAALRAELEGMDIPLEKAGTPEEWNELAEYQMRMADKEVEIHKAVNRVVFLVKRLVDVGNDPEHPSVRSLLSYSSKAVFGDTASLIGFAERMSSEPAGMAALMGDIHRFVGRHLDEKHADAASYGASMDRRLEDAVRLRFYKQRIDELEQKIEELEVERKSDTAAAQAAVAELQALRDLRSRISGPPTSGGRISAPQKAA